MLNYTADLEEFVALIGATVITDDITGGDVDDAVTAYGMTPDRRYSDTSRPDGAFRAPATQQRFRQSVSRFFGYCERHGWVQVSPMLYTAVKPKVRGGLRSERKSLQLPEAEALLTHGPGDPPGPQARSHERNHARDAYLLTLMTVLGPRVHEVSKANRADFSRTADGMQWRIVGKGGVERIVPLSADIVALRDEYRAHRPALGAHLSAAQRADAEKAEFLTGRGARISARDIQRMLHRAYLNVLAKDPDHARDATPHALRHTAATLLLGAGWDVKVVAQMLGHSNIATTSKYLDEIDGELQAAVRDHPVTVSRVPVVS